MVHKKSSKKSEDDDVLFEAQEERAEELIDMEERAEDKLKALREKLAACQKEKHEYLDGWQRLKADILNSKKRQEGERERDKERQTAAFVEKILPLCDSFDMALRSNVEGNEWRTGFEQIYNQLTSIIKSYGVTIIEPKHEPFDPRFHEAVSEMPVSDAALHQTVVDVLQNGYAIGDYLIRPAKVVVGNYENA